MRPILFRISLAGGEFAVGSYSAFYLLAWALGPALGVWFAARRGLEWRRVAAVYYVAMAAGVAGARVLDLFVAGGFYAADPSRAWSFTFQGFSLYGGLGVACIVAVLLARRMGLPLWRLADSAVPGLVAGIVLMRTGCLLRGCCFGERTTLPWGVTYPVGSMAWSQQVVRGQTGLLSALAGDMQPVHPTQVYEMLAAVALGLVALALLRRRVPDGVAFLAFAAGFTAARLGNGFLRARQDVITAPAWFYPALYSAIIALLVALAVWRVVRTRAERRTAAAIYP